MALIFIRVCAVLIGLRSLTNFAKLTQGNNAVLVFFGQMLHGDAVAIPAFGVGVLMLATAIAMWKPSRLGAPLATLYAAFVLINLASFVVSNPEEFQNIGARISSATDPGAVRLWGMVGMGVYSALAIATTAGPAWLLWKRRVCRAADPADPRQCPPCEGRGHCIEQTLFLGRLLRKLLAVLLDHLGLLGGR